MITTLYLKRTGFDFISSQLSDVISCDFPPTAVQDLELLSSQELSDTITAFIETNKLKPSVGVIILAPDVCFEKDLTEDDQTRREEFVTNLPFNSPVYKSYPSTTGQRIVATNADLLEGLKHAFAPAGIMFDVVVPASIMGDGFTVMDGLTKELAKKVQKPDKLKEKALEMTDSATFVPEEREEEAPEMTTSGPEKANKKLIIGGIIFIVLGLGFATFLYMQQQQEMLALTAKNRAQATVVNAMPTMIPSPIPIVTIDPTQLKGLKVQILNGSGIIGQADIVRKQLQLLGFDTIKTGNTTSVGLQKTLIIFSKNIPATIRTQVEEKVVEVTHTLVTSQESNETNFDMTITTAKPTISPTP